MKKTTTLGQTILWRYLLSMLSAVGCQTLRFSLPCLVAFLGIWTAQSLQAQCSCNEYIYLNEPAAGGKVHKYRVASDGTLVEINPTGPWYNNTTAGDQLTEPHGLGRDLNGFLYISETSSGDVRKLDCDGNILPESDFVISGQGGWNFVSIGNELFINRSSQGSVAAYNLCSATFTRAINYCNAENNDWGLHYDPRTGYFYSAYKGTGALTSNKAAILRYTLADFGSGSCIPEWISPGDGVLTPGVKETIGNTFLRGMTTDKDGNLYIVERAPDQATARILKYDTDGKFVKASATDGTNADGGWYLAAGVVYSETCNCLYVSTASQDDDCVARFDLDLNYLGPAVPGNAGGFTEAKAIEIIKECCPDASNATVNRGVCAPASGTVLNLIDFLPCPDICAGKWTEVSGTVGAGGNVATYNDCDNTLTFQNNGTVCFTYDYVPGGNANAICGEFHLNVCITFGEPPSAMATGLAGDCSGNAPRIVVSGIVNGNRIGVSTAGATMYDGPTYATATVLTGTTHTLPGLMNNSTYLVRVFNGGDGCFSEIPVSIGAQTVSVNCGTFPWNGNKR